MKKYQERIDSIGYANTLEYYIEKYGGQIGPDKWIEKNKRIGYANTPEYYIEKYGNSAGKIKWIEWKNKCKISLDSMKIKYGDEMGSKKYKEWLIKIAAVSFKTYSTESEKFFHDLSQISGMNILYANNEYFIYDAQGFRNQKYFLMMDTLNPSIY
ncbi:MAG: hypothetical protein HC831_30465 [Chloroflexia bacterium]|nr:hypothetical protein [Chloroflexia bacterium]